jgi:phospholipid/cholesterol/gamma-HCH transport system substrate-binding protein
MDKSGFGLGRLAVMVGFALSCFGLLLFLWLAFGGPVPLKPKGYQFDVAFPDAATLADEADVRIAGVSVGRVVAREQAPEGNLQLATIELDSKYAPLPSDARAMLRQKTLLGETYVELSQGSQEAEPLEEGARLADGQVRDAVNFDEFLRTFDPATRKAFQRWQQGMAESTEGRAQDINAAIGNFAGFSESASDVLRILDRRREALRALVRETGTTFAAINRDQAALRTLITRNRQVFDTLAAEQESLTEIFQVLPTFQRESRATMTRVADFAERTEPLVTDLEPVLRDTVPTLRNVGRLSPDLRALFNDLPQLVRAGDRGLPALARVLRGLDPTLADLGPFLQQLNPILEFLELYQATVTDFLNVGPSAIKTQLAPPPAGNSMGHVLPQTIVLGSQSVPQPVDADPNNRGNAYFSPDAFRGESGANGFLTLPSWECPNGEHPQRGEEQGCYLHRAFEFLGDVRKYPRVGPAPPGGATRGRGVRR